MSPGQVAKKADPASAGDLLGTLPDALLQHILSFLPAQQAVRTCVLARRWQHLWEDMTGLRITAPNSPDVPCAPDDLALVRELREFVDHLLLLRGRASIDRCEFMFNVPADCDDDVPHVNLWIRHVIRCNVRLLQLSISREDHDSGLYFFVDNLPIVSRHLTRLELTHTGLNDSFLDFSGCPVLEDLVIYNGNFVHVKKIQSKSLKNLSLLDCTNNNQLRTYIDVPNLLSLRLEDPSDRTPVLGSMPSLVTAFVRYSVQTWPHDRCYNSELGDCSDDRCEACKGDTERNKSVLLKGLSEAESLVLIDCCQTGPEYKVKIKGICSAIEGSAAISENLKTVEVKCDIVDDRVIGVLNFLITLNIRYGSEEKKVLAEHGYHHQLPLITMATTPEEFFVNCLMEQSLPSPSEFLDHPLLPHDHGEGQLSPNDMMLPYISRMLMEDDIEDKLSDHPALLQVQEPFAKILFAPSFGASNDNNVDMEVTKDLWQDGSCEQSTIDRAFLEGEGAVGAFLKGMEEAKMFLPKDDSFKRDEPVNQMFKENSNHNGPKDMYNRDEHLEEARRAEKTVTMMEAEGVDVNKMLDEVIVHGFEKCVGYVENLRITMADEVEKNSRKSGVNTVRHVVDLSTLLIYCAQAVATNNHTNAWELLKQIKQHASATGNAMQRLAQCFAKGLEARLVGTGSKLWNLLMVDRPFGMEFLEAYQLYVAACSFDNIALSFSVMTIMDKMAGKYKLHIVDYGLHYGFEWARLLRLLAQREGALPEVKITAIVHPQPRSYAAEEIEKTGHRLYSLALELGLPSFMFRAIRTEWEDICIEDLNTDNNEVLVVNDHFNLSTLMDESVCFDDPNPRDTVLDNIRKMRPDVFVQSIVNCSYGTSFLSRFKSVLFYYMALFDMFDATIPRGSKQRMVLEQRLFGLYAMNVIACEGVDLVQHPEKYKQWQARNKRAGMWQMPLKPDIVKGLENKVKKHHKDFLLCEDGHWILQGWMGRILFAHSAWVAEDA
ncbi:hypothetical protein EJB05_28221 [Eragrostis curvula]|uniref:F-box domain-containing protein n=1 Tax=Eragrostis curvula TaxID=38414 RepID=A0A5J9UQ74_9POAL|nr:hypothetical protein EJB05_28221 [Eragrostis curvula]